MCTIYYKYLEVFGKIIPELKAFLISNQLFTLKIQLRTVFISALFLIRMARLFTKVNCPFPIIYMLLWSEYNYRLWNYQKSLGD